MSSDHGRKNIHPQFKPQAQILSFNLWSVNFHHQLYSTKKSGRKLGEKVKSVKSKGLSRRALKKQ